MRLCTAPTLADFFEVIADDARITTLHISLYMALAFKYSASKAKEPFQVTRRELMHLAKISSRHTYNKGMHELQEFGYIKYMPTHTPASGSLIVFKTLQ